MNLEKNTLKYTPNGYGLYNGTLGHSIANYLMWRLDKKPKLKKRATIFLNETAQNLGQTSNYTIKEGVLGLGWGVEWLAENKLININVNNFLEDLDDEVYKICVHKTTTLTIDWFDVVLYIRKRVNTKNVQLSFYKKICLKECLRLVIDHICSLIVENDESMFSSSAIAKGIAILSTIRDAKADTSNITKQALEKYILALQHKIDDKQVQAKDIIVANALKTAAKNLNNPKYIDIANKITRLSKKDSQLVNNGNAFNMLLQIDRYNKFKWKEAWFQ